MLDTIPKLSAIIPRGENTFESQNVGDKMGNLADIAYGGSTLAFAVNSASATVKPNYHLYSAMGNFLGPVVLDRKMFSSVQILRDTKAFATREVRIIQKYPDGKTRLVLTMLADFQVAEKVSIFTYSAKPSMVYSPLADTLPLAEYRKTLVEDGIVKKQEVAAAEKIFAAMTRYFDNQPCPEAVGSQNLASIAKNVKTTQDHLSITEKTSADWYKHREPLASQADNVAAVFYLMDGAMSFVPLSHSHQTLSDAGACSTLDYALRFFSNHVSMDKWHLREIKTVTGGNGRTYTESRLWDEQGNMVASMTQQSIMRPSAAHLANL